jgi:large subunit ribosomal protein L14
MIQPQTVLQVSDNSGAKTAICIKVLGGYRKRYAYVGDSVVVSIKSIRSKNKSTVKIRKGDVCQAIVIRTKKNFVLKDGSTIFFSKNCISLMLKGGGPLGTRIVGPMLKDFKRNKLSKFISISSGRV